MASTTFPKLRFRQCRTSAPLAREDPAIQGPHCSRWPGLGEPVSTCPAMLARGLGWGVTFKIGMNPMRPDILSGREVVKGAMQEHCFGLDWCSGWLSERFVIAGQAAFGAPTRQSLGQTIGDHRIRAILRMACSVMTTFGIRPLATTNNPLARFAANVPNRRNSSQG